MRRFLIALAVLCVSTPALAEAPTVNPDQDFIGVGFELTSSGKVEVYAAPRQVGGKLAICGLVLVEKATNTTKVIERRFTATIQFRLAGKLVAVQTAFFKRYYDRADLATAVAGCSVTPTPWDKSFAKAEFKMDMGRVTIRD